MPSPGVGVKIMNEISAAGDKYALPSQGREFSA